MALEVGTRLTRGDQPTDPTDTPTLVWSAKSPSEYLAELTDVSGTFLLVLADTYAPEWIIEGLPTGWRAEHIMVDGYANGWRISGAGHAAITLRYGPQTVVRYAMALSAGSLVIAVALLALGTSRRRGGRVPQAGRRGFWRWGRRTSRSAAGLHGQHSRPGDITPVPGPLGFGPPPQAPPTMRTHPEQVAPTRTGPVPW